jgi:hypothetical protein
MSSARRSREAHVARVKWYRQYFRQAPTLVPGQALPHDVGDFDASGTDIERDESGEGVGDFQIPVLFRVAGGRERRPS